MLDAGIDVGEGAGYMAAICAIVAEILSDNRRYIDGRTVSVCGLPARSPSPADVKGRVPRNLQATGPIEP
jgi:hypothetical protein